MLSERFRRIAKRGAAAALSIAIAGTPTATTTAFDLYSGQAIEHTNSAEVFSPEHKLLDSEVEIIASVLAAFTDTSLDPAYFTKLSQALNNPDGLFSRQFELGYEDYPNGYRYVYFPDGADYYSFNMFVEDPGSDEKIPRLVDLSMQLNTQGTLFMGNGDLLPLMVEDPKEKASLDIIERVSTLLFNIPMDMLFSPYILKISEDYPQIPDPILSMSRTFKDLNGNSYYQYADQTGIIQFAVLFDSELLAQNNK